MHQGNKTATVTWPDPYSDFKCSNKRLFLINEPIVERNIVPALLPIPGVVNNLGSSSQLRSFAGGEACNWCGLTMNQTTLQATRLADMAPATPIHGPGLQLSPCGSRHSRCMHKPQFYVSGKRPIHMMVQWKYVPLTHLPSNHHMVSWCHTSW